MYSTRFKRMRVVLGSVVLCLVLLLSTFALTGTAASAHTARISLKCTGNTIYTYAPKGHKGKEARWLCRPIFQGSPASGGFGL
jgi:hypothetical protein